MTLLQRAGRVAPPSQYFGNDPVSAAMLSTEEIAARGDSRRVGNVNSKDSASSEAGGGAI